MSEFQPVQSIEPSKEELIPFNRARWKRLTRRGFTAPVLMISAAVSLLFYYQGEVGLGYRVARVCNAAPGAARLRVANQTNINPFVDCSIIPDLMQRSYDAAERFSQVFGLMMLGLFVFWVYSRAGRRIKPSVLVGVFVLLAASMWFWSPSVQAPLFFVIKNPLEYVFDDLGSTWGLRGVWLRTLITTALPEEIYKLIPLFIALWATSHAREPWRTRLRVTEPLDGIVFGVTAAAAFIYAETFSLYTRGQLNSLLSLQLSIPRVLGGLAGHMAYSAIAAYYVTLGWTRSRNKWLLVATGLLLGSALHATWNTFGSIGEGMTGAIVTTVIKVGAFGLMLTVIQAARDFSPARLASGKSGDTFSFDTATLEAPVFVAPATETTATPASANLGFTQMATSPPINGIVRLTTSNNFVDLSSGDVVSIEHWPGLVSMSGDGIVARLLTHPDDATRHGLRNNSTEHWTALNSGEGRSVTVAPGTVVTLKDGMSIRTSNGTVAIAVTAPSAPA